MVSRPSLLSGVPATCVAYGTTLFLVVAAANTPIEPRCIEARRRNVVAVRRRRGALVAQPSNAEAVKQRRRNPSVRAWYCSALFMRIAGIE